jgi:hypothetical protein
MGVKYEHLTFIPHINQDGLLRNLASRANPMQVKSRRKTLSTEEKFDVIIRLEKSEGIVDTYRNVTLAHSSERTIPVITGRAKARTTVFV